VESLHIRPRLQQQRAKGDFAKLSRSVLYYSENSRSGLVPLCVQTPNPSHRDEIGASYFRPRKCPQGHGVCSAIFS